VFVELGPRMQGVISARAFREPPRQGERHRFTLRGKEESLWALALEEARSLATWREMEVGTVVPARVLRTVEGGLQLKIGALHAFLPRSQAGLPRGKKLDPLLGRTLTVEVIEIDPERQRVIVSRKPVIEREKRSGSTQHLRPGRIVRGRVARLESYGAFVTFGHGQEGLVHVSNLAHERVAHPADVLQVGQAVEARVLFVRRGGKRIELGIKQLQACPWRALEREAQGGTVFQGTVTRVADFGVFVALESGIEGLLPNSESGRVERAGRWLAVGRRVWVRVVELDAEEERAILSLLRADGSRIAPEDADAVIDFSEYQRARGDAGAAGPVGTRLGPLLQRALGLLPGPGGAAGAAG